MDFKEEGYYLRVSRDSNRGMVEYLIVKDEEDGLRTIYGDLNYKGFLRAKNEMGLKIVNIESSFVNYTPFSYRNKDKVPMIEKVSRINN